MGVAPGSTASVIAALSALLLTVVPAGGAQAQEVTYGNGVEGEGLETEILLAPTDIVVYQTDYGDESAVEIHWSNPEAYETVEFAVDGDDVPCIEISGSACGDGADGFGLLAAPTGTHSFGVRGRMGSRVSTWAEAEFLVLEDSPVPEPILNLDCEYVPIRGGTLILRWDLGADPWILGRLGFTDDAAMPRIGGFQAVEDQATAAEILVPLEDDGTPASAQPVIAFRNEAGYFSPRFTPPCERRTPQFRRGDCDSSGRVNITDAIYNLNHLFVEGPRGFCDDACDSNDDGVIDLSDSITTLEYLFKGGPLLPAPGPSVCGIDDSEDFLGGICFCPEAPQRALADR